MNGDGGENDQEENRTCMEQFLHRQLLVLHSIITFLYGPVIEEYVQTFICDTLPADTRC